MSVLLFMLFGLVVGLIAKAIMPGRDPAGFIIAMAVGMVGSLLGGLLGRTFGLYADSSHGAGWIMSIVGAVALLAVYRFASSRQTFAR